MSLRELTTRAITAGLALGVAAAVLFTASQLEEQPAVAAAAAARYNTGPRWPGDHPSVCIEDHTRAAGGQGAGFPVEAAAAEYADFVSFEIAEDCAAAANVVRVSTVNDQDLQSSGWASRDDRGWLIQLNLAQAFRLTPHDWRMLLVHELGHTLGLVHTFETDSVMHPQTFAVHGGLTTADRDQLRQLYGGR